MGPSQLQTLSGLKGDSQDVCEIESVLGVLPGLAPHVPKEKDVQIIEKLNIGLNIHNKRRMPQLSFHMLLPIQ